MNKALVYILVSFWCVAFGAACGDDDPSQDGGANPPGDGDGDGDAGDGDGDAAVDAGRDAGDGDGDGDAAFWATTGHDFGNTYHNPFERKLSADNADTLVEKWTFTTAGAPHGGLSVAEGMVFVSTTGGVHALNLADGTEVWKRTDVTADGTAAYADGALYVHTTGAVLYKLDAATGEDIWVSEKTYDIAGADGTSTPAIGGGLVIVGHSAGVNEVSGNLMTTSMSKGGVEAFDVETGERAWTYETCTGDEEDGAMVWSTVAIDLEMGIVFATTGNNYTVAGPNSDAFHAIELSTGEQLWRTQVREGDQWSVASSTSEDTDFGANPILAQIGDRKVVAAADKAAAFWVLDRVTGEIIWQKEDLTETHSPAFGGVLNNGAFDGTNFYLMSNAPIEDPNAGPLGPVTGSMTLHALGAEDGDAAWEPRVFADRMTWGMASVANGVLAVPVNNELHILNAATGETLTMFDTGGSIAAGAPAIVDGMVIVKSGMQYFFGRDFALRNEEVRAYGLP
jgi:outer membrane protein assembly factor BamB